MPGFKTHLSWGAGSATLVGFVTLASVPDDMRFWYLAGSAVGGAGGGVAPDFIEPTVHPRHRQTFHRMGMLGLVGYGSLAEGSLLPNVTGSLVRDALACRASRGRVAPRDPDHSRLHWREARCYFLLGAVRGFVAGYASHLLLDARTAMGLPLL